jgi:N-acetyl-gamma-glutamyl-phosphate reductase
LAKQVRAAVVGATGYTGAEAVRLLSQHPSVEIVAVTSERQAGTPIKVACPWLECELDLTRFDADALDADVAFLCQSSSVAMKVVPSLAKRMKVVDLSADFRLSDASQYQEWYGTEHACPGFRPWPVYGLPELVDRTAIASAQVVANPGCYVTASLLALVPLKRAGLIAGTPVIDAKSGVSGAGRSRGETDYLLGELHGSFKPYKTTGHRHTPEIEQMFGGAVRFTPHLLPVSRGICATIHVQLAANKSAAVVLDCWSSAYQGEPFVRVQSDPPSTKQVHGSNTCALFADFDERTGFAVLVSVIDNLVKGASGQAVQNMNLMFDLPETAGLQVAGVWP